MLCRWQCKKCVLKKQTLSSNTYDDVLKCPLRKEQLVSNMRDNLHLSWGDQHTYHLTYTPLINWELVNIRGYRNWEPVNKVGPMTCE